MSTVSEYGHRPNWALHADANMGHGFAILLPHVGTLRPSGSGAGELGR